MYVCVWVTLIRWCHSPASDLPWVKGLNMSSVLERLRADKTTNSHTLMSESVCVWKVRPAGWSTGTQTLEFWGEFRVSLMNFQLRVLRRVWKLTIRTKETIKSGCTYKTHTHRERETLIYTVTSKVCRYEIINIFNNEILRLKNETYYRVGSSFMSSDFLFPR